MLRLLGSALALGTLIALTAGLGNVALADHVRVTANVTVAPAEKAEQGYTLSVRLRTADGKPVNETTVRFYQVVDLFGEREMYITAVLTDGQGSASTTYLPAATGRLDLVARSSGRDHFLDTEERFTFEASVAAAPYRLAPVPLAPFTDRLPYGVGAVVLSVWALIAFALVGTALGIRRGRRDQRHIA